jgi:hypothetical protein
VLLLLFVAKIFKTIDVDVDFFDILSKITVVVVVDY